MATTFISIIKIAGPLVQETAGRFSRWHDIVRETKGAKAAGALDERSIIDDEKTVKEIRFFRETLEKNADKPPVLFFTKFIDSWTVAPSLRFFLEMETLKLFSQIVRTSDLDLIFVNSYSWWTLSRNLRKILRQPTLKKNIEFDRKFFLTMLRFSANSWEKLLQREEIDRGLIFTFQAVGGSWFDEEVIKECSSLPKWYPSEAGKNNPK